MSEDIVTVRAGTTLDAELDAVADAWERAAQGEAVRHHVVAFETLESMLSVLTPARLQLLRHLGTHPARSVRALAGTLDRDYSRVHGDVAALEHAGLVVRGLHSVRVTADTLRFDVHLTEPVAV